MLQVIGIWLSAQTDINHLSAALCKSSYLCAGIWVASLDSSEEDGWPARRSRTGQGGPGSSWYFVYISYILDVIGYISGSYFLYF